MSKNRTNRAGKILVNNQGVKFRIIKHITSENMNIQFLDEHGAIIKGVQYSALKRGQVKNPYFPNVCGVGYYGEDELKNKDYCKIWRGMLSRCYDKKTQERNPTYKGVEVCKEWWNYQNFAKWCRDNFVEGWQLDKDILCPTCKVYSPETCSFVPYEINNLYKQIARENKIPTGVNPRRGGYVANITIDRKNKFLGDFDTKEEASQAYNRIKEQHIKKIAEQYKDKIDPRVYEAMINFVVEK